MNSNQNWLINIAKKVNPEARIPEHIDLAESPTKNWQYIARLCRISTNELAAAVADNFGMPLVENSDIDVNTVRSVPEKTSRELFMLPVKKTADEIIIGTCEPEPADEQIKKLRFVIDSALNLKFHIVSPDTIEMTLMAAFAKPTHFSLNLDEMNTGNDSGKDLTVRLAKALLRDAIDKRASDIHVQPFGGGGIIRFRIDGMLQRVASVPAETLESLSRFFKVHGKMDSSKKMIAQDGRVRLTLDNNEIDVRLSILPTFGGERIVARLLDQKRIFSMRRSGYSISDQQTIKRLTSNRSGIILITGPTGSGKSSTLYSVLSDMNRSEHNIMSIENPVEYVLQGISQTEVNDKQGLTFASALRSILRQDPDVVLVGEIRDSETALIATQAAMTGHLVLSTLHTNDSISAVTRMLKLDVDASVLADSLIGVVAQRLVRQLCPNCKERVTEDNITPAEKTFQEISSLMPGFRAKGCDLCSFTGYQGRLPITEIFEITPQVSELIFNGQTSHRELMEASPAFKNLAASAALLVVSGDTTIDESFRVVGREFWSGLAKQYNKRLPETFAMPSDEDDTVPGVLLISENNACREDMAAVLEQHNFMPFFCSTPQEAKVMLQENVDIVFVIADVPDLPEEQIVQQMRDARLELYWSKLPALLIMPEGSETLQQKLIEDGAVSKMMTRPTRPQEIVEYIESYALNDAAV